MEIGGLGFVNTLAATMKGGTQQSSASGFLGVLGAVLTEGSTESKNISLSSNEIPKEELLELIQLLQAEDILEVEGGVELLTKALSTDDQQELMMLIEGSFVEDKKLIDLIGLVLGHQGLKEDQVNDEATTEIEDLISALEQVLSIPIKDLGQVLNGEMKDVIKSIKLFDLIANDKNFNHENAPLKDLLQQLTKKLELLTENGKPVLQDSSKQNGRAEFLQKTFQTVAAEVNANLSNRNQNGEASTEQKTFQLKSENVNGFLSFQQMSKAEQLTLTLHQNNRPVHTADLIKQFENILARSQFSNVAGTQKLLIKLNPEHLGALRIELIQRDAGIVAKIMTTTQLARETLETHLNGLRQAFGSQNIQVDRVEVSQAMTQQQERFFGRGQEQESQQEWQENEEKNQHDDSLEKQSFDFSLEEALVNTEV